MYKQLTVILLFAGGLMISNTAILNEAYAYTSSPSGTKTMFGHFTLVVKVTYFRSLSSPPVP